MAATEKMKETPRGLYSLIAATLEEGVSEPQRPLPAPTAGQRPATDSAAFRPRPVGAFPLKESPQSVEDKMAKTFNFFRKGGYGAVNAITMSVCALPGPTTVTPKSCESLQQAGLGKSSLLIPLDAGHSQIEAELQLRYPKLADLSAGWLFKKTTGGGGQRKLETIPMEAGGYTGQQFKDVKSTLYIVPIQEYMDTTPLPPDHQQFANMPRKTCNTCGISLPLPMLTAHVETCGPLGNNPIEVEDDPGPDSSDEATEGPVTLNCRKSGEGLNAVSCPVISPITCPVCQKEFSSDLIEIHASYCGESSSAVHLPSSSPSRAELPSSSVSRPDLPSSSVSRPDHLPSSVSCAEQPNNTSVEEWMATEDPERAASLFTALLFKGQSRAEMLWLCMDLTRGLEEQDRSLLSFYKRSRVNWASPLACELKGDSAVGVTRYLLSTISNRLLNGFHINMGQAAVTRLFEGEPGHLIPSTQDFLVDSDFYVIAGRMAGHGFLHGGPGLPGLSPAVVHVLVGGIPDTATVVLEDCPDVEFRGLVQLLQGKDPITEINKARIAEFCISWSVPPLIEGNRMWLFERLLRHAVLVCTIRQCKQFRKGLKETGIWPIIQARADVVPRLFPNAPEAYTAEIVAVESRCRVTSQFIHNELEVEHSQLEKIRSELCGQETTAGNEMQVLEAKMEEVQRCRDELMAEVSELKNDTAAMEHKGDRLMDETGILFAQGELLQQEVQGLKSQSENMQCSLQAAEEDIQAKRELLAKTQQASALETEMFHEQMAASQGEVKRLCDEIKSKEGQLALLKEESSAQSILLKQEVQSLQKQIEHMGGCLKKVEEETRAQLAVLTRQEEEGAHQRELLQQQLSASEEQVRSMREEIQAKEEQLAVLKDGTSAHSKELQEEVQALKKQVESGKESLKNSVEEEQAKVELLAKCYQKIEAMQEQMAASEKQMHMLMMQIQAKEGVIQAKEVLLSKNQEDRVQREELLQSQITSSMEEIEQLKKSVQEKENVLLGAEEKVKNLQTELSIVTSLSADQDQQLKGFRDKINTKEQLLATLQEERSHQVEVLQHEIKELKAQAEHLSCSLKTAQEDIHAKQHLLAASQEEVKALRGETSIKGGQLALQKDGCSTQSGLLQGLKKMMDDHVKKAQEEAQLTVLDIQEQERDQKELPLQQLSASKEQVGSVREEKQAKEEQLVVLKNETSVLLQQEVQALKKHVESTESLQNAVAEAQAKEDCLSYMGQPAAGLNFLMPGHLPRNTAAPAMSTSSSSHQRHQTRGSKRSAAVNTIQSPEAKRKVTTSCFPQPLTPRSRHLSGSSSSCTELRAPLSPDLPQCRETMMCSTSENTPKKNDYLQKGLNKLRSATRNCGAENGAWTSSVTRGSR